MRYGKLFVRLYFADPVFGANDRVSGGGGGGGNDDGLPPELKGKTPAEISRYYQDREATLRRELQQTPPAPPPNTPPPNPTNADFWNNPTDAASRMMAKALSKAEFEATAAAIRPSLIWAAKEQCKQQNPDFHRVEKEVDAMMAKIPEWQRTDPVMWNTTYTYAKGEAYTRLSTEDRTNPPSSTAERQTAAGSQAPPPMEDLTKVTLPGLLPKHTAKHVAENLGISDDSYRKSAKELEGDGRLPMTYDNRGKR